jgi:hypothetical protein
MSRTGKVARLPKAVREKLNLRLEDNEPANELLKWLNNLPQTQKVLKSQFNGAPINKQNLSDWKTGGFRDWQAQQEALNAMQQMADDADELQDSSTDPLSDKVSTWLLARYFLKLKQALAAGGADELKLLHKFCGDVVALRRGDHYSARLKLQEEKLEREKGESEEQIMEYFQDWVKNPDVNDWIRDNTMSEEEKDLAIQAILFPNRNLDEDTTEDEDSDEDEDTDEDDDADEETDEDMEADEEEETNENQTPSSSNALPATFPVLVDAGNGRLVEVEVDVASGKPLPLNPPNTETTPTTPAATETTPPGSQGQSRSVKVSQAWSTLVNLSRRNQMKAEPASNQSRTRSNHSNHFFPDLPPSYSFSVRDWATRKVNRAR